MITPMSPAYNRNQTSFGMAFQKPSKDVIGHFKKAITGLTPDERKAFVEDMAKIVESQKKNPVPICQSLAAGYSPEYAASVGNKLLYNTSLKSPAARILDTMQQAAKEADNQHNLHTNMQKINEIFDIKA